MTYLRLPESFFAIAGVFNRFCSGISILNAMTGNTLAVERVGGISHVVGEQCEVGAVGTLEIINLCPFA